MHAVVKEFRRRLERSYPVFAPIVARDYAEFGEPWAREFSENIETLFGPPEEGRWDEALRGYVLFSLDVLRSQRFLERHGRYEATEGDELQSQYWDNPEFMLTNYLPGIFTSHFLWPQHYRLLRFYGSEVVPRLRGREGFEFAEVGTGPGLYSKQTLTLVESSRGVGYDLSELSLSFAARVAEAFGVADRYRVDRRDVVAAPPDPVDLVLCLEVLEHIADPLPFLSALRGMVRTNGHAYISVAVTAAQSDHVLLFHEPHEARELLETAGFSILVERTEAADTTNDRELIPRVSAFLCRVAP